MLVAIGDTHGSDGHRLAGAAREAVREADRVVHTGDFTTTAVLDAFEAEAAELTAVVGNNDHRRVRERCPKTATLDALGLRFVVAHGHEHDDTSLSLLARQEDADIVVVGHSHSPIIDALDDVTLVNPGSHADPRWYEPAFATFERTGDADASTDVDANADAEANPLVEVVLRRPDGDVLDSATV